MILDERTEFADALAINTGGAASYLLGDVYDLGAAPTLQDVGLGEDLFFVIQVDTLFASATGTIAFHLASDSVAAIAVDGSATYHFSTAAQTVAAGGFAAGKVIAAVKLPVGSYERYLGVLQTTAVAAFTAGKINAFLTRDFAKWVALPNAVGA